DQPLEAALEPSHAVLADHVGIFGLDLGHHLDGTREHGAAVRGEANDNAAPVAWVRQALDQSSGFDFLAELACRLARGPHAPRQRTDARALGIEVAEKPWEGGLHLRDSEAAHAGDRFVGHDPRNPEKKA